MSKHLSLSDRALIERMIHMDFNFAQIAKKLDRTPSTISREIKKHRVFTGPYNVSSRCDCIHFFSCLKNCLCDAKSGNCFARCKLCKDVDCTQICKSYESFHCNLLDKPPYVCTGCSNQKLCKKEHAYYTAHRAHSMYLNTLKESRSGIRTSPEDLIRIDNAMTQYNKITALYNIFDKADFIARKRIRNHLQMSGRQCQFLRYHALTRACRIFSKPELMA